MSALNFPDIPTPGEVFDNQWQWDGSKWVSAPLPVLQVPIAFSFPGMPAAGMHIVVPMVNAITIPAGLTGSVGLCEVAPTAVVEFSVNNIAGAIGVATVETDGSISFSGIGGNLAIGDSLIVQAPITADATMASVGLTILATRT